MSKEVASKIRKERASVLIRRGLQANLPSDNLLKGEMLLAEDTGNVFICKSADKLSHISSDVGYEQLIAMPRGEDLINSIIDYSKWDDDVYTGSVDKFRNLFIELHDIDTHFYYVFKHNKLYRYPKKCYHERTDVIDVHVRVSDYVDGIVPPDGLITTFFSFADLMNGRAIDFINQLYKEYHPPLGGFEIKVSRWRGMGKNSQDLHQEDFSKMPIYNPYLNRIEFDGKNHYMVLSQLIVVDNWDVEWFMPYFFSKEPTVIFGGSYDRNIWLNRGGYITFRASRKEFIKLIPIYDCSNKQMKMSATVANKIKLYENNNLLTEETSVNTELLLINVGKGYVANNSYAHKTYFEGSITKLKFKSNNEILLDFQI